MDILSFTGDLFNGAIETDVGRISWSFDDDCICSENFGVNSTHNLKELVGQSIINFDFEISDNQQEHNDAELRFNMEDKTVVITFYNEHNGYYEHNLDIYVDDKLKWNVSL